MRVARRQGPIQEGAGWIDQELHGHRLTLRSSDQAGTGRGYGYGIAREFDQCRNEAFGRARNHFLSLLNEIEQIARNAGQAIMAIYGRDFSIEEKDDRSPLTEADIAADTIITTGLKSVTPSVPILSEEAVEDFKGPNETGQYWLVDPLDGTKEFIKKNGEFTVNIALIENGIPIMGVVYAPALNLMYSATVGEGASKTDPNGKRTLIRVVQREAETPLKVVGSRSHGGDSLNAWLQNIGEHELLSMGSSLKFCLVAEGKADIYPRFGPTSLWDTAAAQCVVEQAGGEVIQINGPRLSYCNTQALLNPHFIARATTIEKVHFVNPATVFITRPSHDPRRPSEIESE